MDERNLCRVFDQVKPSPEWEEAMLDRLLNGERKAKPVNELKKMKKLTAALAAAVLLLMACAFTTAMGLDQRVLDYFRAGQEDETLLSGAAFRVGASHTYENGWTVQVGEVLADRFSVAVFLDFTAPDGVVLSGPVSTDGCFTQIDYSVYDAAGEQVKFVADYPKNSVGQGMDVCYDLEDSRPEEGHVSLLWFYHVGGGDYYKNPGVYTMLGAEVTLTPRALSVEGSGERIEFADEGWSCTFTLPKTDSGLACSIRQPLQLGDYGAQLLAVYISPISFSYEFGTYSLDGGYGNVLYEEGPRSCFITMRDGSSVSFRQEFQHFSSAVENGLAYDSQGASFTGRDHVELYPEKFVTPAEVASVTLFGQTFSLDELEPAELVPGSPETDGN